MSMNRQLRRAQDKQDKKLEKAKQERRDERVKRLAKLREERDRRRVKAAAQYQARKDGKEVKPAAAGAKPAERSGRDPGRFSAVLAAATTFFILLQIFVPTPPENVLDSVIKAGFYLMFGYFVMIFLLRRGNANAFPITLVGGFFLLVATFFAQFSRQASSLDTLSMALSIPLLLGGIWLGRLVHSQTDA